MVKSAGTLYGCCALQLEVNPLYIVLYALYKEAASGIVTCEMHICSTLSQFAIIVYNMLLLTDNLIVNIQ